jgi:hypothetical protein
MRGEEKAMNADDQAYHSERALRELDLGLTSSSMPAARAHLQLSSLHREKVMEIREAGARLKPPCILD